jgi:dihydroorotate dehydrogenase electron transfer subunit
MSALHPSYCPDHAAQVRTKVFFNRQIARDTYQLRFAAPSIAKAIVPGQFLMIRLARLNDPLLARPLALYDVTPEFAGGADHFVDVVYLVKGKFTTLLAEQGENAPLDVWGPLGNGFATTPADHLIMVAGGIGQTPFLAVAKEAFGIREFGSPRRTVFPPRRVTFCYGARTADYFAGLNQFEEAGVELRLCTDDGSRGQHGLVTEALSTVLQETELAARIVCCGPEPMMAAVSRIAAEANVPCQVSLETPMACGLGICFTCVAMIQDEAGHADYKRTCVEGPIFDATKVIW